MKIIISRLSEEELERREYQDKFSIDVDETRLYFADGEPEDNNLSRNFSDVYSIPKLLKKAYNAGKNGEKFEIEEKEIDEE